MFELFCDLDKMRLRSFFLAYFFALLSASFAKECSFEIGMHGSWFQSGRGHQPSVRVNSTHFFNGRCVEVGKSNRYLVHFGKENCHKCMVINMKHHNVIQYKESNCDANSNDLSTLCQTITGDAALFSMFRLHGEPVRCPFSGPLTFTYSKGYGECSTPMSQVDSCAEDSRLLFRQQACADVPKSESREEEIICLATWKDGSNHYLAAKLNHTHANSNEDRYRCFIYENPSDKKKKVLALSSKTKEKNPVWHLSVSADATCHGLVTAHEGSKTMKMRKVSKSSKRCRFPGWFSHNAAWHSLDYSQTYTIYKHNTSINIEDRSSAQKQASTDMRLICYEYLPTRSIRQDHSKQTTLVTHFTTGCRSGYKCMRIYRRHKHVIQIQLGEESVSPAEACTPYYWKPMTDPMFTIVSPHDATGDCGPIGRYEIPNRRINCQQQVTDRIGEMVIGCSSTDSLQIHAFCPRKTIENYQCHTHWTDANVVYVIASPVSRASGAPKRLCFAYVIQDMIDQAPNEVAFSSRKDTCIAAQNNAHFAFNATFIGKCITASGISSASNRSFVIAIHLATCFVSSILLTYQYIR